MFKIFVFVLIIGVILYSLIKDLKVSFYTFQFQIVHLY